jgi:hypothetical protein
MAWWQVRRGAVIAATVALSLNLYLAKLRAARRYANARIKSFVYSLAHET